MYSQPNWHQAEQFNSATLVSPLPAEDFPEGSIGRSKRATLGRTRGERGACTAWPAILDPRERITAVDGSLITLIPQPTAGRSTNAPYPIPASGACPSGACAISCWSVAGKSLGYLARHGQYCSGQ